MKISLACLAALTFVAMSCAVSRGQVPQLISYQGRVVSNGTNFHGPGQFKFALVDGAGAQTFWNNDGSSVAGAEPAGAVTLNVNQGLVLVFLGDTSLSNMTPISSGVFVTNGDVRLRIWFSDGGAFQPLSPDQRIVSVGYAMMAASVADGSISDRHLSASGALSPTRLKVGVNQTLTGNVSTIAGGSNNAATADGGAISGGQNNRVTDNFGVVAGGANNLAGNADGTLNNAPFATIGGGQQNAATEDYATVAGGWTNTASGFASAVGGGRDNVANGSYATVPGGQKNRASGNNSFAAGTRAQALHRGAFVWADSNDADFASGGNDVFIIRAANGVGINTSSPTAGLDVFGSGRFSQQLQVEGRLSVKTANPSADLDINGSARIAQSLAIDGPLGLAASSNPSAITNVILLYGKAVSGKTELFIKNEDGNETQLTIGGVLNDNAVKLTSDQTVGGIKTFSSIPVLPASSPSSDNQAASKKYVDDQGVSLSSTLSALVAAARISLIKNYGTSASSGTTINQSDLKLCFGRVSVTGNVTVSNLPFTSASSYVVLLGPYNDDGGYASQAMNIAGQTASQFTIRDFTTSRSCFWLAIGQ